MSRDQQNFRICLKKVRQFVQAQPHPVSVRKIQQAIKDNSLNTFSYRWLDRAVWRLLQDGKIKRIRSTNRFAYCPARLPPPPSPRPLPSMTNVYIIHARPEKPSPTAKLITIDTDTRQRALHFGTLFQRNGWREVGISYNGKEYTPDMFKELP